MNFDFIKEYGKRTGIYCITDNVNGEKYIGQTIISFISRYNAHKSQCFYRKSSKGYRKSKMYAALRKYGWGNFSFEILYFCNNQKEMDDLERYFIAHFNTEQKGMNTALGGHSGKVHSEASKKKMSKIKKNQSQETRAKISKALMGHKHSDEAKSKMSKSHSGKKCPWKRGSFSQKQIQKSIDRRSVPVFMFNDKEIIGYFASVLAAAKWLNANNMIKSRFSRGSSHPEASIRACLKRKHKVSYGYKWMESPKQESI